MDAAPFTSTESALFRNNEMYVNLHNAENMSGEIRGQINRGQVCYNTTLGINELNKELNVDVFPNPFNAELQINGSELTDAVSYVFYLFLKVIWYTPFEIIISVCDF